MYIFYDLETSSRSFLGQILTYSFLVTDENFTIKDELFGKIRLNRIQLPDPESILVNKINILSHQNDPNSISEYKAAKRIAFFLNKQISLYLDCTLVGFNSNSFDLQFLRNLLIRYGINPYFEGHLHNLDVYQFAQYLAYEFPEKFPWLIAKNKANFPYYIFNLQSLAKRFCSLDFIQTHSASDDNFLTIKVVQNLEKKFKIKLGDFEPFKPIFTKTEIENFQVTKQKINDSVQENRNPEKYIYKFWLKLFSGKKDLILLDLVNFESNPDNPIQNIKYINANKHFFRSEFITQKELNFFEPSLIKAKNNDFLRTLSKEKYFELIKKNWDIEEQIYELGFERIGDLNRLVERFMKNPDNYYADIKRLAAANLEIKDRYLIQLYNRIYLNYHPQVKIEYLQKYLVPRYITGQIVKNINEFKSIQEQIDFIKNQLISAEQNSVDHNLMQALLNYYENFCQINQLLI